MRNRIAALLTTLLISLAAPAQADVVRFVKFYGLDLVPVNPVGLCTAGNYCQYMNSGNSFLNLTLPSGSSVTLADTLGNTRMNLKYPATVGTWAQGLVAQDPTDLNIINYAPALAGTTGWYQWAGQFANIGPRANQVMTFGWNAGPGGGRQTPGALNGTIGNSYEQYFESPTPVMEGHQYFVDPADQQTRYIDFSGSLTAPYSTRLFLTSGTLAMGFGHSPADLVRQIELTSLSSVMRGPDTVGNLFIDPSQTILSAGNGVGANNAKLTLFPSPGQVYLRGDYNGLLVSGSGLTRYLGWGPGFGTELWLGGPGIASVLPGADATNVTTTQPSSTLTFRGARWDGVSTIGVNADIIHEVLTATPTSQLNFYINSASKLRLVDNGGGIATLRLGTSTFNLYNDGQTEGFVVQPGGVSVIAGGSTMVNFYSGFGFVAPGSDLALKLGNFNRRWTEFNGQHFVGGQTASPTCAPGAGAGTGGTCAVLAHGTDFSGTLEVVSGTLPSGSGAVVATVTLNAVGQNTATCVLSPANNAAALLAITTAVYVDKAAGNTSTWVVKNASAGAISNTLDYNYTCTDSSL